MVGYARYGIQFQLGGYNNAVTNNTVADCDYGLAIRGSDENVVSGNTVSNSIYGIMLEEQSLKNKIAGNSLTNNDVAITIWDSKLNTVIGNNLTSNDMGIELWWASSEDNTIKQNIIMNHWRGIILLYTADNIIAENTIADNEVGVMGSLVGFSINKHLGQWLSFWWELLE